jgi:hypothetical protein
MKITTVHVVRGDEMQTVRAEPPITISPGDRIQVRVGRASEVIVRHGKRGRAVARIPLDVGTTALGFDDGTSAIFTRS